MLCQFWQRPVSLVVLTLGAVGSSGLVACGSSRHNDDGSSTEAGVGATSGNGQGGTFAAATSTSAATGSGTMGGSGGSGDTSTTNAGSTDAGGSGTRSSTGQGGSAGGGGEGGTTYAACDDFSVPAGRTPCVGDTECAGPDMACFLPSSSPAPACGAGCGATRTCASDEDCAENAICVEYEDPCCVALGMDAIGTYCIARCTETSCADGICGDDGRCEEVPCEPGTCGDNQDCNTESGRCQFRPCLSDADCDCGFCQGVCQNGPGYCDFTTSG